MDDLKSWVIHVRSPRGTIAKHIQQAHHMRKAVEQALKHHLSVYHEEGEAILAMEEGYEP